MGFERLRRAFGQPRLARRLCQVVDQSGASLDRSAAELLLWSRGHLVRGRVGVGVRARARIRVRVRDRV